MYFKMRKNVRGQIPMVITKRRKTNEVIISRQSLAETIAGRGQPFPVKYWERRSIL